MSNRVNHTENIYPIKLLLFFLMSWFQLSISAQDTLSIRFRPLWNNELLELNKKYITSNDTITIETLRFYISDIVFYNHEKPVAFINKKHHLLDFEDTVSFVITHFSDSALLFNTIKFKIGIDSLTNVLGVYGGDLDPTKGMYWTWQSGYINLKLEGVSKRCATRHNRYQLHVGGYLFPFYSLQEVVLKTENPSNIGIEIRLDKFLTETLAEQPCEIMSPSLNAVKIAGRFADAFNIAK
jgi:hypothetical protein